MKGLMERAKAPRVRETLTEAYEVRAFRDEDEAISVLEPGEPGAPEIPHAEEGAFLKIKSMIKGHGEQMVLPDDCQFGDNDLCSVET
jgi:hypothetical protein